MTSRFLLPAGYLPKIVDLKNFDLYENLRTGKFAGGKTIAQGYEYYYLVRNKAEDINNSLIAGKIRGVHGPWTRMKDYSSILSKALSHLIFKPSAGNTCQEGIINTINFASEVKAEYVVFHTSELDLKDPENHVKEIKKLCKNKNITLFLENEGKDGLKGIFANNSYPKWYSDPIPLYEEFNIPIVFDPATIEINGGEINSEWSNLEKINKDINEVIGHVHLNELIPNTGHDHGTVKSAHHRELLRQIVHSNYSGYFTFEVNGIQTHFDELLSYLFGAAVLTGLTTLFPSISRIYGQTSQKQLYDSIVFAEKHLQTV